MLQGEGKTPKQTRCVSSFSSLPPSFTIYLSSCSVFIFLIWFNSIRFLVHSDGFSSIFSGFWLNFNFHIKKKIETFCWSNHKSKLEVSSENSTQNSWICSSYCEYNCNFSSIKKLKSLLFFFFLLQGA